MEVDQCERELTPDFGQMPVHGSHFYFPLVAIPDFSPLDVLFCAPRPVV